MVKWSAQIGHRGKEFRSPLKWQFLEKSSMNTRRGEEKKERSEEESLDGSKNKQKRRRKNKVVVEGKKKNLKLVGR